VKVSRHSTPPRATNTPRLWGRTSGQRVCAIHMPVMALRVSREIAGKASVISGRRSAASSVAATTATSSVVSPPSDYGPYTPLLSPPDITGIRRAPRPVKPPQLSTAAGQARITLPPVGHYLHSQVDPRLDALAPYIFAAVYLGTFIIGTQLL